MCLDLECIRSAASLIERINFDADPCDNFYDFACGRFLQTKAVPDDHSSRNILQEIQDDIYVEMKNYLEQADDKDDLKSIKKVKMFYASCMNETTANDEIEAMAVIVKLIESSGGKWPTLELIVSGQEATESHLDLEKRLSASFMNQVQSIFHFYVSPLEKNSTGYAFHVSCPTFFRESPIKWTIESGKQMWLEGKRWILPTTVASSLVHLTESRLE